MESAIRRISWYFKTVIKFNLGLLVVYLLVSATSILRDHYSTRACNAVCIKCV